MSKLCEGVECVRAGDPHAALAQKLHLPIAARLLDRAGAGLPHDESFTHACLSFFLPFLIFSFFSFLFLFSFPCFLSSCLILELLLLFYFKLKVRKHLAY